MLPPSDGEEEEEEEEEEEATLASSSSWRLSLAVPIIIMWLQPSLSLPLARMRTRAARWFGDDRCHKGR
jgi:H+/gluconate symporter-like permease